MAYLKYQPDYLFTGKEILFNQSVLITDEKGVIQTIIDKTDAGEDLQILKGLLSPGFINCHCHLELSHMKGVIPEHTGLVDFILNILQHRNSNENDILQAIKDGEAEMKNNGIVAVGDISNNALTLDQKLKGNLKYHNFIELSGFSPAIAQMRFDNGLAIYEAFKKHFPNTTSIVPHAPYSVSKELFQLIDSVENNHLSSIHNQETFAENEFFISGNGNFNKLYNAISVEVSSFHQPTAKSSLQSVLPFLNQPKKLLLVHDTFISQNDLDFLFKNNAIQQYFFCLCVNANSYIENQLPPINLLRNNHCNIVIGTDSLASNHGLCVLSEIKTIIQNFPEIPLQEVLIWATKNGAMALQMDDTLGSFEPGKQPGLVLITDLMDDGSITINSKTKVISP